MCDLLAMEVNASVCSNCSLIQCMPFHVYFVRLKSMFHCNNVYYVVKRATIFLVQRATLKILFRFFAFVLTVSSFETLVRSLATQYSLCICFGVVYVYDTKNIYTNASETQYICQTFSIKLG